ncbi:hypothetical protein AAVH_34194, partial [Aphelenchoides avenae]
MSKFFVAVLAFSTVSLALGYEGPSLGLFLSNPKIKVLASVSPDTKELYPGDDTNYANLLKALAALQKPLGSEKVKEVLKEHAPSLYRRVLAGEAAYDKVRDSVQNEEAKGYLNKYRYIVEKYLLVGLEIDEKAKQTERLPNDFNTLNAEAKKVVAEKLKEAAEAVADAMNKPS